MNRRLIGTTVLAAALALPTMAIAQTTVRELQSINSVTISGEVVRVYGEDFILDDGTGQLLVEAESRPMREANLRIGERVTVLGVYDDDNSLEANSITRVNGEVIYIFDD